MLLDCGLCSFCGHNSAAEAVGIACVAFCGAGCSLGILDRCSTDVVRGILGNGFSLGCVTNSAGIGFYTGCFACCGGGDFAGIVGVRHSKRLIVTHCVIPTVAFMI